MEWRDQVAVVTGGARASAEQRRGSCRSSPPPAPMGLRGVWVVAARCCADTIERRFGMSKRKRARTSKARSSSKVRAKAARRQTARHHQTRANSKQSRVADAASQQVTQYCAPHEEGGIEAQDIFC
jgi:hypothetical protein